MAEINETKIRKELIDIYSRFLKDPENKLVKKEATKLEKEYGGLLSYLEHSSKIQISIEIKKALNNLSSLIQYGIYEDSHPAFSNKKIIKKAKEILKSLG